MRPPLRRGRVAVSDVVGALTLIIVVVIAVTALAVFISSAQKNAEANANYLTNVQNDDLQVVFAQFSPSSPLVQWEIDSCPADSFGSSYSGAWYVQQGLGASADVTLTPKGPHGGPSVQAVFTSPLAYNNISKGELMTPTGATSPYALSLGGGPCAFEPATWSWINATVRNTNTQASALSGVAVSDGNRSYPASVWYEVSQGGTVIKALGEKVAPLVIPARATVEIGVTTLDLPLPLNGTSFGTTSIAFAKIDPLMLVVSSTVGNYFSTPYSPPLAIARSSAIAESFQGVSRDVLTFEGNGSYSGHSSIATYLWALDVPKQGTPGCSALSFATSSDYDTLYFEGPTIQYSPAAFPSTDCLTGPIRATLTVSDQNGLVGTSTPLIVSTDPNLDPVAGISASPVGSCSTSPCTVKVTATDSFGNPMGGVPIDAIPTFGDAVTNQTSKATGPTGVAEFQVSFTNGGSVDFETGTLVPAELAFP